MDKKHVRKYSARIPKTPSKRASSPSYHEVEDEIEEIEPLKPTKLSPRQLTIPRSSPSIADVLGEALELNVENVHLLSFVEDEEASYLDRATLTLADPPYILPPLRLDCRIQELAIFPHSVVAARNRRRRSTSHDEYFIHAELDPSAILAFNGKFQIFNSHSFECVLLTPELHSITTQYCVLNNVETDIALLAMLEKSGICPIIALNCGLITSADNYREERSNFQVKVRGLKGRDLYLTKKVAKEFEECETNCDGDNRPIEFKMLPKQGTDFAELKKPFGYELLPMIPVRADTRLLRPSDNIRLPMDGTIYFDIVQGACDFSSGGRTVRQINLAPTPVAVDLHSRKKGTKNKTDSIPQGLASPATLAKRRRLS